MARNVSLNGLVFASSANTNIPIVPIAGASYRNTSITDEEVKNGWGFSSIVDSKNVNEVFYRITSLLNEIEQTGFLVWSDLTDYPIGAIARYEGDGVFYEAIAASGPDNGGAKQPNTQTAYWKVADLSGGASSAFPDVIFTSTNTNAVINKIYYCDGAMTLNLPSSPANMDSLIIASGANVDFSHVVAIRNGTVEGEQVSFNQPKECVWLVYNMMDATWKKVPFASLADLKKSPYATGTYTFVKGGTTYNYDGGYQELGNGLYLQWGKATIPTAGIYVFSLPIAFSNAIFSIVSNSTGMDAQRLYTNGTLSSFTYESEGSEANFEFMFTAIGN